MVTPAHIKPVWYFTPYYAMLRAIPDKLFGVIVMGAAVMILFLVPWLDRSPVKSIRYRGWPSKVMIAGFVVSFVWLGYIGASPAHRHADPDRPRPDGVLLRLLPRHAAGGRGWARPSPCPTG